MKDFVISINFFFRPETFLKLQDLFVLFQLRLAHFLQAESYWFVCFENTVLNSHIRVKGTGQRIEFYECALYEILSYKQIKQNLLWA